jgi:hypothetical protein
MEETLRMVLGIEIAGDFGAQEAAGNGVRRITRKPGCAARRSDIDN